MIIYSEKTLGEYKSVEECLAAEAEYDKVLKAKEEEKKLWEAQKTERAEEVAKAFNDYIKASQRYCNLKDAYVRDYGNLKLGVRGDEVFVYTEDF